MGQVRATHCPLSVPLAGRAPGSLQDSPAPGEMGVAPWFGFGVSMAWLPAGGGTEAALVSSKGAVCF